MTALVSDALSENDVGRGRSALSIDILEIRHNCAPVLRCFTTFVIIRYNTYTTSYDMSQLRHFSLRFYSTFLRHALTRNHRMYYNLNMFYMQRPSNYCTTIVSFAPFVMRCNWTFAIMRFNKTYLHFSDMRNDKTFKVPSKSLLIRISIQI